MSKAFERSQHSDHLEDLARLRLDDPEHPAVHLVHVQQRDQTQDLLQKQALLNEQAAHFYERAANASTSADDVASLQLLSKHFKDQARFKRSLSSSTDSMSSAHGNHGASDGSTASQIRSLQEQQYEDHGDDDSEMVDSSHDSSNLQALSRELKNLFLLPWEMLYTRAIEPLPGQYNDTKQAYRATLEKAQRSYHILMNIAESSHRDSQAYSLGSGISSSGSGNIGSGSNSSSSSRSDDIHQRLQSLNNSLTAIQTARLESRVADLEKALEKEKKLRTRYQKEAKKYKSRWERQKHSIEDKQQKDG